MMGHWATLFSAIPLLAQAPGFSVDVNLVRVPCVVIAANGAPVQGLRSADFVVLEDGVPQKVKYLWQEMDLPLTVGVVGCCIATPHQRAVLELFSRMLSPEDRAFLVSAGSQPRLLTDWTNSAEQLRAGPDHVDAPAAPILGEPCSGTHPTSWSKQSPPCGDTVLWDSVFFAARLKLRAQDARKAMLILADGWDTGSDRGVTDAIEACQGADAVVYSIRVPSLWDSTPLLFPTVGPYRAAKEAKSELQRISRETGGLALAGKEDQMPALFRRIEADLRSQYVLGYTPSVSNGSRTYRAIKVKVTRPGVSVRARSGYYAQ
jgi:Ca-activated chloride channel family protein